MNKPVHRWLIEASLVLAILSAGIAIGWTYDRTFRATGQKEDFGQREFGAAVAQACGYGFVNPGYFLAPQYAQFLLLERDSITCADLPKEIPRNLPNLTQGLYRYLMTAAVIVWKIRGISWSGLAPLFGLAYGLTLVAAYGVFRIGMGRVLALTMTAVLGVSAVNLGYLPYLRDYAKAPFILTLILIMARLALGPFERRRALALSAAFGVVLGIGFGFRNDILINLLPWVAVVLFCTRGGTFKNLGLKAACLAVSIALFAVVASPILVAYKRGSNTGHVAMLGLMTPFDTALGVGGSNYEWGYTYSDGFVQTLITSYTERMQGRSVDYMSREYDQALVGYILTIARHWPADILIRAYGSIHKVLEFPFEVGVHINPVPYGIKAPRLLALYAWQAWLLNLLAGCGIYFVGVALAVIAATSIRASLILLFFVLYFGGYPAIQFNARHFFHLEFIPWWALGFVIQRLYDVIRHGALTRSEIPPGAIRRVVAFAGLTALLVLVPVVALRGYQEGHVRELVAGQYLGARREPLQIEAQPAGEGRTLLAIPQLWRPRKSPMPVDAEYIVAEFSPRACKTDRLTATFRYRSNSPSSDFSENVNVKVLPGDGSTQIFFPGYRLEGVSELAGIELPALDADCLAGVSRILPADRPELLVNLNLPVHWQQAKLYQTLTEFELSDDGDGPPTKRYAYPYTLPIETLSAVTPIAAGETAGPALSAIAKADRAGWTIEGRPPSSYAYLMQFTPETLPAGSKLVVEGELRSGGISIGILKDERWAGSVNIFEEPCEFIATILAPESGVYSVIVSSYSKPRLMEQYVPSRLKRFLPGVLVGASPVDAAIRKAGWSRNGV